MDGYRIWRVALGHQEHVDIHEVDYIEIRKARYVLNEQSYLLEKFFAVSESYKTVERFIHEATLDTFLGRQIDIPEIRGVGAEFGRVTSLLLSSVRLYQDTAGSHLREITADKNKLSLTKGFLKDKYDASFEYRLMEAVRNFAQHKAFPVHSASYGSKHDYENGVINFAAKFEFIASKVVDAKFKASVLEEVGKHGGTIDLKQAARVYFADICDVHQQVSEEASPFIAAAEATLETWQKAWTEEIGENLIGVAAVRFIGDVLDQGTPIVYIGPQMDEYRLRLRRQTARLTAMHGKRLTL